MSKLSELFPSGLGRRPMDIYATTKVDPTKELPLDGGIYLRSAWPEVEKNFNNPMPKAGNFDAYLLSTNITASTRNYGRLIYNKKSKVLLLMHGLHNTANSIGKSVDDGVTWTTLSPVGLANSQVDGHIIAKFNDDTLIVVRTTSLNSGHSFSIERSVDNGATWTSTKTGNLLSTSSNRYVLGDTDDRSPRGDLLCYKGVWYFVTAGSSGFDMYMSLDDGLTWSVTVCPYYTNGYMGIPRLFIRKDRLLIFARNVHGYTRIIISSMALDLTNNLLLVNQGDAGGMEATRASFVQLNEEIYWVSTRGPGEYNAPIMYVFDSATNIIRTNNLTGSHYSTNANAVYCNFNPYDAILFTEAPGQSPSVFHIRARNYVQATTNLSIAVMNSATPSYTQLGIVPFNPGYGSIYADVTGDGEGTVFIKDQTIIYKSTATYLQTFQTPSISGTGWPGASVGEQYATNLVNVIRGAV